MAIQKLNKAFWFIDVSKIGLQTDFYRLWLSSVKPARFQLKYSRGRCNGVGGVPVSGLGWLAVIKRSMCLLICQRESQCICIKSNVCIARSMHLYQIKCVHCQERVSWRKSTGSCLNTAFNFFSPSLSTTEAAMDMIYIGPKKCLDTQVKGRVGNLFYKNCLKLSNK